MPAGLPRQSAEKTRERRGKGYMWRREVVSSLRGSSLTIALSEMRGELVRLHFQLRGLPKLNTSFSLHHKPQEKCRLPFSPSLRCACFSSFALLSALFQLHSAAYVYSGLHQLGVHV